MSCDNNYINGFEVCSLNAIKFLNDYNDFYKQNKIENQLFSSNFVYHNNKDLNSKIRNPETNEYIYTYDKNKKDLCYKIDNKDKDEYLINCAILENSPFYTYNKNTNKCEFIPNFELPNNFSYSIDNKGKISIFNNLQQDEDYFKFKYEKNIQQAYCEDKWYDWIITPNYHFGNKYEKDFGEFSKLDVKKCYKPCPLNHMPYIKEDKTRICVNKTNAMNGLIQNKLDFSPIALINLIGNTEKTLTLLYQSIYNKNILNYQNNNSIYSPNKNYIKKIDNNPSNFFKEDNIEITNAYEEIKKTLNSILNKSQTIDNKNFNKYENYKDIITYKNPNFNENDPELLTLKAMNNSQMLTDEILIHTYYLAYNYSKYINQDIFNLTNYPKDETNEKRIIFDKINNHEFNPTNNIKKLMDLNSGDANTIHRLLNILYKAINICYDNKTDFSINIHILTKKAFENNPENLYKSLFEGYKDITIINIEDYTYDIYDEKTTKLKEVFLIKNTGINENRIDNTIIENIKKNKNIILYGEEFNEYTSKCKPGQLYDINKKECVECKDFCNEDKCNTSIACKNFCPVVCDKYKEDDNNQPQCGSIKKKKEGSNSDPKKILISTPIQEETVNSHIPNLSKLVKILIKIIFAGIFLYICYMFYDLFGEAMLSFINMLHYFILKLGLFLYNLISRLLGFLGSENSFNSGEAEKIRSDIVYEYTKDKLNRLIDNTNRIINKNK